MVVVDDADLVFLHLHLYPTRVDGLSFFVGLLMRMRMVVESAVVAVVD